MDWSFSGSAYYNTLLLPGLVTAASALFIFLSLLLETCNSRRAASKDPVHANCLDESCVEDSNGRPTFIERLGGFTIAAFQIIRLLCALALFSISCFTTFWWQDRNRNASSPVLATDIAQIAICVTYVSLSREYYSWTCNWLKHA